MPTVSSSSSRRAERLIRVPLEQLHAHPLNANVMEPERLATLSRNIERESRYPPLIVRPHPDHEGGYQILDGHQRAAVLRQLGRDDAVCYVWPCDDAEALILLATLNRLEGADSPILRAQLLADLQRLLPGDELTLLLPEDAGQIDDLLSLLDLDVDALLAEFEQPVGPDAGEHLRAFTVALTSEQEAIVEQAVALATADLTGKQKRGRGLVSIAEAYLEAHRA